LFVFSRFALDDEHILGSLIHTAIDANG